MTEINTIKDKIKGSIYGLALGDAWGYPLEFLNYNDITTNKQNYLNNIPQTLTISDDTQMSIYNINTIKKILQKHSKEELELLPSNKKLQDNIRLEFAREQMKFVSDPYNTRAPGLACMESLHTFAVKDEKGETENGLEGITIHTINSNGCGTIMRAGWIGLLPLSETAITCLAILQAQITHGDPRGGISSAIDALIIHHLINHTNTPNPNKKEYFDIALQKIKTIENINSNLINKNTVEQLKNELVEQSEKFEAWYLTPFGDISNIFGAGWVSQDALYTSLVALNIAKNTNNPLDGIRAAITTEGDSDSIGAIAGAMIGTLFGYESINPNNLTTHFEKHYQPILEDINKYIISLY